jgi:hypothetical protein
MKNNQPTIVVALLLIGLLSGIFYFKMPQSFDRNEAPLSEFSTKRALEKIKQITKKPHYIGSQNHTLVANYLVKELQDLGLQTSVQEGFTMTEKGTLVKAKNILAKIKGTSPEVSGALSVTDSSKALLLLSHYDSAPHSYSHGASDDASGVATILESVRAFLHNKTSRSLENKNDIIILFTDAEEIGLNGAALFVTQHQWAKDVGLVLNFEARGSSGPSYMLMETNQGNAKMIDAFKAGNATYPVSNSLMYSIYKMLPNDTDLTVFREKAQIQGFNFAFIDSHYDYHTARDNYQNLAPNSVAHQGSYLFPLLNYFATADLSDLNSSDDHVYFSVPFVMVSYPFSWIFPMLLIAFGLLAIITFIGLGKRTLRLEEVLKGFVPFFAALLTSGIVTYIGWKLLLSFYPQYNDILHGFTYNGHDYMYAFISLTLAICFLFYKKQPKKGAAMNQLLAPVFIWLLVNTAIAFQLKGASFFIIPALCSIIMLAVYVFTQKSYWFLNLILSLPALFLVVPFITLLPIGLGLKVLYGSSILTVLTFTLLLPIFGNFEKKKIGSFTFFILAVGMLVKAHQAADYSTDRPKPNSLVYVLDAEAKKASWATYDADLDVWTKGYLGEKPTDAKAINTNKLYSKYGSAYRFMAEAPMKNIPASNIEFITDSISDSGHFYQIKISPNRNVNRYDIFVKNGITIQNLIANGVQSTNFKSAISGKTSGKILSYYVVENLPLLLEFKIKNNEKLDLELLESSFDLMSHPDFTITKRKSWMMPMPFVLTDAVIIKQKIKPATIVVVPQKPVFSNRRFTPLDSLNNIMDSIK